MYGLDLLHKEPRLTNVKYPQIFTRQQMAFAECVSCCDGEFHRTPLSSIPDGEYSYTENSRTVKFTVLQHQVVRVEGRL